MEGMPVRAAQRQQVLLNHLRPVSLASFMQGSRRRGCDALLPILVLMTLACYSRRALQLHPSRTSSSWCEHILLFLGVYQTVSGVW